MYSKELMKDQLTKGFIALALVVSAMLPIYSKTVQAQQVAGLYKAEEAVQSQSDEVKQEAMKQAFEEVLIRVTGETKHLENSTLKEALNTPDTYVKGYSYRRDTVGAKQLYLDITFEPEAVNRLLRSAGLPIWGGNRPTTLLLLAIDQDGERSIQADNSTDQVVQGFDAQFKKRSLPLIFPLMDVKDTSLVSPVDVWGFFISNLTPISKRYHADAILVGRLSENQGIYDGRLVFSFRNQPLKEATVTDLNIAQLALVAADLAGSALANHYAVASLDSQDSRLLVEQVKSFKDYSDLLNYLNKLTAVRSVQVRRLAGSTIELDLRIDGQRNQLIDTIALGRHLKPKDNGSIENLTNIQQGELHYRWIRR
ncbi:MAG: DUF2066 domain-containing protein [Endozoicomonas sp. (ex Botrylloides leachii)]|nr:DUF2066 domain-containing protein [Endozoicomonas sp. (ex Botrylloides leachii)]